MQSMYQGHRRPSHVQALRVDVAVQAAGPQNIPACGLSTDQGRALCNALLHLRWLCAGACHWQLSKVESHGMPQPCPAIHTMHHMAQSTGGGGSKLTVCMTTAAARASRPACTTPRCYSYPHDSEIPFDVAHVEVPIKMELPNPQQQEQQQQNFAHLKWAHP